ncbi:hypothetical protein M378DRAFT_174566 [Amanita muscaria Koide BX008]|uniref:Uncharacterized protein n=1 Tax=Amanita muscaria (strain Koide BX008) TaxID=946122 RepID=A0A0C2WCI9_AMAMK|nr:hypothetical protein M378DRAFT_174566 [Amanita muscaria Koide BX008]
MAWDSGQLLQNTILTLPLTSALRLGLNKKHHSLAAQTPSSTPMDTKMPGSSFNSFHRVSRTAVDKDGKRDHLSQERK